MVDYFLQGGSFMWPILVSLIFGLGFVLERAYSLMLSGIDSSKFFDAVTQKISEGDTKAAIQICNEEKGPVASIFHAGLSKAHRGLDDVEKAIQNAGAIEMAFLEKNMIWLNAVITIAPMLGFTGTVVGMIGAFDAIEAAGDISPSLVAGGIKVALLTTVFGLIVAMILQVFYNYLIAKVDSIVNSMEDASISLVDLLVKNK